MPEIDVTALLGAGGIAPPGAKVPKATRAASVSARTYAHPALPGRVVVRLSTEAIAPGVDIEMETIGFGAPKIEAKVGVQQERSLGFPGWALIHDPGHAKFALAVMKDFKKAAARAKSKPGHARDAFVEIGLRLARSVPHFLPSFWEEAGRAFLAEGSETFAAQAFEKARIAEKEHALEIDEEVRGSTFLEFALAGAVGVKSLQAYAKVLVEKLGEEEGYERFFELTRRRTVGGMPPWSGMGKELRTLAKAAKKNVEREDERFLGEVINANALRGAPQEFWTSYEPALVRLADASPAVRDRLRRLFPKPSNGDDAFRSKWLDLLDACNALEAVTATSGDEAAREAHGMAADWLEKLIAFATWDPKVVAIARRMVPRLVAEGTNVQIAPGNAWWASLNVDLVELALETGIPIAEVPERAKIQLNHPFTSDPVRTGADPRFARRLADAVGQVFGEAEFEKRAAGRAGLLAARKAWLERTIATAKESAIVGLVESLGQLAKRTRPETFTEFPESRAALLALDAKTNLAHALRGGVFAEHAWPAFESAVAELDAQTIVGAFPYAVVMNATRAIVVSGADRVLEHDLRMPPKSRRGDGILYVVDANGSGQVLVSFWDSEASSYRAYWSGSPDDGFTFVPAYGISKIALPLPGGGLSFGSRPFRIGDTKLEARSGVLTDGAAVYAVENEQGKLVVSEINAGTGQKIREAMPPIVAATIGEGMKLAQVSLQRAPAGLGRSPLGMKDGLVGYWRVTNETGTVVVTHRVDGLVAERRADGIVPTALLVFPGDDRPRVVHEKPYNEQSFLHDPDGRALGSVHRTSDWASRGWKLAPPLAFWHFLVPRDPHGSAALRQVTDELAGKLLDVARREIAEKEQPATLAAVRSLLPEITNDALREGVVGVVVRAAQAAEELANLVTARTDPNASADVLDEGPDDQTLRNALRGVIVAHWGTGHVTRQLRHAMASLEGRGTVTTQSSLAWENLYGSIRGVAVLAIAPFASDETRTTLRAFLGAWRKTLLSRDPTHIRLVDGAISDASPFYQRNGDRPKPTWIGSEGKSLYFVRVNNLAELPASTLRSATLVEHAPDGDFRVPPRFNVFSERRLTTPDDAWLDDFFATLDARGIPPWNPDTAADLAQRSGLTRSEAILLAAGLPGIDDYGANFLTKETREALGLSMSDARIARETFKALAPNVRLALATAMAPDDPTALWTPFGDGGPIARLAAAWIERSGRAVTIREDVLALVAKGIDTPHAGAPLLHALIDPATAPILVAGNGARTLDEAFAWSRPAHSDRFTPAVLMSCAMLLPFLFQELPVGDAYRDALPSLVAAVNARLADPATLLPVVSSYGAKESRALFDSLGGDTVTLPEEIERRDDGVLVVELSRQGVQLRAAVRPAKVGSWNDATTVWKLHGTSEYHSVRALSAAAFLQDHAPAFLARIASTPVPAGSYEANPLVSAPKAVGDMAAKHTLSPEAATLYLQLLALAEPTAKRVQVFNGWKPATYKKAEAELLAKKLVVQGKRERAGREIFLPGGWEKGAGQDLPQESWKKPLFAIPHGGLGRMLPPQPLHTMFEAAWARIASGDAPKFEEV